MSTSPTARSTSAGTLTSGRGRHAEERPGAHGADGRRSRPGARQAGGATKSPATTTSSSAEPSAATSAGHKLRDRYKAALKKAGLRELRFHDLRHTFGSHAIRTADSREVMEWMGHQDLRHNAALPPVQAAPGRCPPHLRGIPRRIPTQVSRSASRVSGDRSCSQPTQRASSTRVKRRPRCPIRTWGRPRDRTNS